MTKHLPLVQYGTLHGDQRVVGTISVEENGDISGKITHPNLMEAINGLPHGSFTIVSEPAVPSVVDE